MFATAPDPVSVATDLANNAGGSMITTITGVLPVLIPILGCLWAIGLVVKKVPLFKAKAKV